MVTAIAAVDIMIDDGVESLLCHVPWHKGLTVMDATLTLRRCADIAVAYSGRGRTAFLTQLGHRSNQGRRGHNWVYRINGKVGVRGIGVQVLNADDRVEWLYEIVR
jgi:hypothetical protein